MAKINHGGGLLSLHFRVCIALLSGRGASACFIQGVDSGTCAAAQDIQDQMPFCANVVTYTACVPRAVPWFPNVSVAAKDAWASETYSSFVAERIGIENGNIQPADQTLYNYYTGPVTRRFTGQGAQDCMNAYRNFMCWLNFPRCDNAGNSFLLCTSVCENMMLACGYPKVMWRCYNPAYYGGLQGEGMANDQVYSTTGSPEFLRALFPGLPFMPNAFLNNNIDPVVVCTPSIKGGASSSAVSIIATVVFAVSSASLILWHK